MKHLLLAFSLILPAHAQAPGVTIFEQSRTGIRNEEKAISKQMEALIKEDNFPKLETIQATLETPAPISLNLPSVRKKPLEPTKIAKVARESGYRVGWAYLCKNCDNWHINLAGGYALTEDGVLGTCAHVIKMDGEKIRKGGLIAVDHKGKVFPVTSILANHEKIDGALIKIEAKTTPLALNDQTRPGDAAFCLSRPLGQGQYFSKGIVNRFFWNTTDRGSDDSSLQAMGALKLNVSSRWAPGSSGSAVLDVCGNVIGHVALIGNMGNRKKKDEDKETLITLHTATPARAMMTLAKKPE